MRNLLIAIMLSTWCCAEDVESFKLKDGREIIGTYNETDGTITMSGAGNAVVRVDKRDIVSRDPAAPVEPKKKVKKESEAKPDAAPAEAIAIKHEIADAMKQYATAQERIKVGEAARDSFIQNYFMTADLSPITVVIPTDPTDREMLEAQRLRTFNDQMATIKRVREQYQIKAISGRPQLVRNVGPIGQFLKKYGEEKKVEWLAELYSE